LRLFSFGVYGLALAALALVFLALMTAIRFSIHDKSFSSDLFFFCTKVFVLPYFAKYDFNNQVEGQNGRCFLVRGFLKRVKTYESLALGECWQRVSGRKPLLGKAGEVKWMEGSQLQWWLCRLKVADSGLMDGTTSARCGVRCSEK